MLESFLALGIPVNNLTKHVRFLTDKAKVYNSSALIKYNLAVREKAEIVGPSAFVYGDHDLGHMFLGMDALNPKGKTSKDSTQPSS